MFKVKDVVSGFSHLGGAILSVVGLVVLIHLAVLRGTTWHLASYLVFGISLILLYTASTVYHLWPAGERETTVLKKIDHMMIFVLIAGTYTPICLISLRGVQGWALFGCVWGIALLGMLMKIFWINAPRWFSTIIYLAMGWLIVVAVGPLINSLSYPALTWLILGGMLYTIGAVIYGLKRPNIIPGFGFHEIFHFFVLGGSFSHFWLMVRLVL